MKVPRTTVFLRRNARANFTRPDVLLLKLKPETQVTCNAAISKWCEASAHARGTLTLLLRKSVLVWAIAIVSIEEDA